LTAKLLQHLTRTV